MIVKKILLILLILIVINNNVEAKDEFVSVDLEESIKLALENNETIKQSKAREEEAKQKLSEARRKTGFNIEYEFRGEAIGGEHRKHYEGEHSDFKHSATVSIPLYSGGRLENEQLAAKYAMNAAELELENTKQEIKYQASKAYYEVLLWRDMININEEAVKGLEEYLTKAQAQFELGRAAKADVLSVNVQIANAKKNLRSAQGEYYKSMAALNNVIGLPIQTQLAIHDQLKYTKYDLNIDESIEYALKNRSDVAAANYEVKQAEAIISAERSNFRPQIKAEANRTNSGEKLFTTDHERSWSAGVVASWNIFDNGVTNSKVKEKQAKLKEYESVVNELNERIKLEVHKAFIDLQTEEDNIKIVSTAVSQAEEEFSLAQVRYIEGVGNNLAVLDAQEKLFEAKKNYHNALFNYSSAKAALDKVIGLKT